MSPKGTNHISALSNDLLYYIFNLNADSMAQINDSARKGFVNYDDMRLTEKHDRREARPDFMMPLGERTRLFALTTTRRTSQVCQRWRQVLLASTSIWGRLIDLDIMQNTKTPELGEEIFRRAGNTSRLSIKGTTTYGSPTCDFAFWLVREHWTRLEWVNIFIKTKDPLSRDQTEFWSTITTPAPNLRRFCFIFSVPVAANPQILTEDAPALKELCATPSSPPNFCSSWFRGLTFLSIDGAGKPENLFTLPEFLDGLSQMSHVEILQLYYTRIAQGDYLEHRKVQLPTLRKLILEDDFNTCFSVLQHLNPSSKCALKIHAGDLQNIPVEQYWKLRSQLERYLRGRPYNDRLLIDFQPKYFSFIDAYPDCFPEPTTDIRIIYDPRINKSYALSFFSHFPRDKFGHVKSLWFRLNIPTFREHYSDFVLQFWEFSHGLKSLEVLKTNTIGFVFLTLSSVPFAEGPAALLTLQRVRMISDSNSDDLYDLDTPLDLDFVRRFVQFFDERKRLGNPPKCLDVRGCEGDLTMLETCTELQVASSSEQYRHGGIPDVYICGSGIPEFLIIEDY